MRKKGGIKKLEIGDKVRVVKYVDKGNGVSKNITEINTGTVEFINKDFITIQYANYKGTFSFAGMINQQGEVLQIRKDKQWQSITKEDINNTIGLQHVLVRDKYLIKEQYISEYEKETEYKNLKKMRYKKDKELVR